MLTAPSSLMLVFFAVDFAIALVVVVVFSFPFAVGFLLCDLAVALVLLLVFSFPFADVAVKAVKYIPIIIEQKHC